MDLSALDPSKGGADLHLRHPATGAPLGEGATAVMLNLASADSPAFQNARRAAQNGRLNRKAGKVNIEELDDEGIDLLATVTLGWSNIEIDGAPLTFSVENAKRLYRRFRWMREQADEFISDRANFLSNSATSFVPSPPESMKTAPTK